MYKNWTHGAMVIWFMRDSRRGQTSTINIKRYIEGEQQGMCNAIR